MVFRGSVFFSSSSFSLFSSLGGTFLSSPFFGFSFSTRPSSSLQKSLERPATGRWNSPNISGGGGSKKEGSRKQNPRTQIGGGAKSGRFSTTNRFPKRRESHVRLQDMLGFVEGRGGGGAST